MEFHTSYSYYDRKSKAKFVWNKYKNLLKGRILDIGADQCFLKEYLKEDTYYVGIGLSNSVDIYIDLEREKIPFEENSFDCVLCLDVLEHLDNIHDIFDDICSVSKKYVIISLPNPHGVFWHYLRHYNYNEHQHMKFYGLPLDKPEDRHKWFFSTEEAKKFILYRAKKSNMKIVQIDFEGVEVPKFGLVKKLIFRLFLKQYFNLISNQNLYTGTLWVVLKKEVS